MKTTLVLVGFALTLVASMPHGQNAPSNPRIVDGQDAKRRQFPYMLSIHEFGTHSCGAAIISPTFAASAAHCYSPYSVLTAYAGLLDQGEDNPDVQVHEVDEVFFHPDYQSAYNDIALLRLKTPVVFNDAVQPAILPQPWENITGQVVLSGWGRFSVSPSLYPTRLQFLEMPVITVEECNARFKENGAYPFEIVDSHVCTLPNRAKQSACHGDSGGPLVQNGKLVGVVKGGDGYCGTQMDEESPNVFTRVAAFTDFIKEHVTDL